MMDRIRDSMQNQVPSRLRKIDENDLMKESI